MLLDFSRISAMPISIKSEHVDALLAEVRELTGEGITDAIAKSLEIRLAELKQGPRASPDEIHQLAQELRDTFALPGWEAGDPELSLTHGALLYHDGLPQ